MSILHQIHFLFLLLSCLQPFLLRPHPSLCQLSIYSFCIMIFIFVCFTFFFRFYIEERLYGTYSCLENPVDGGAWWATVHGVAKSWTQLSDFIFTFHCHELEKEMATHSSVLAWRIPGTGEPGGLPSMGLHRVRPD